VKLKQVFIIGILSLVVITAIGFVWVMPRAPREVAVDVPSGLDRLSLAHMLAKDLGWSKAEQESFASIYAQMHWAAFNTAAADALSDEFDWQERERNIFLTSSTEYFEPSRDFLATVYEPGAYTFSSDLSLAQIAAKFVGRAEAAVEEGDTAAFIIERMQREAAAEVARFVRNEIDMLPDLLPAPASDLTLDDSTGQLRLQFSTTYFNSGNGPLELRADPRTAGIGGDLERIVFQRIYDVDGAYRDTEVGVFFWHEPHVHYHFADFILYTLEAVDVEGEVPDLSQIQQKTTFCVRDISRTDEVLEHRASNAAYRLCGQERQGISVGWGDTYFFTYPDQYLNMSNVPSGVYKLSFIVNPESRFEELSEENNTSSVTFRLDVEQRTVSVLETYPATSPKLEHVYVEQSI
jgi:hypothetical protein